MAAADEEEDAAGIETQLGFETDSQTGSHCFAWEPFFIIHLASGRCEYTRMTALPPKPSYRIDGLGGPSYRGNISTAGRLKDGSEWLQL